MCVTNEELRFTKSEIGELFDEYDWTYGCGIDVALDVWKSPQAKGPFIEAFKTLPDYVEGKFMIAKTADYEREISEDPSREFSRWLLRKLQTNEVELPAEIEEQRQKERCTYLPDRLYNFIYYLHNYATRTITESTANHLNEIVPEVHAHAGQKTSRVINKLCTYLGFSKLDDYNKEYAKYADSLSPLKIKRHTILSVHPIDFLTMSFGNSWASCHTIDKGNRRGMPYSYSGEYCSGTMSYMLDGTSMVLYTVDASYEGDKFYTQPKITRQMFHFGEDKLVQSRLYPQGNDGASDLYTTYRNIVQQILSEAFEFPNLWTVGRGTDKASQYICTHGTHYPDYHYVSDCTLSRIKGSENEEYIVVGHNPICIECGEEHRKDDTINCCRTSGGCHCEECGDWIDEDDAIWVDGDMYCRDCVNYCEHCDEFHRDYEYYIEGYGYVCESCYNNYYDRCEDCECAYHSDDMYYIENLDITVCPDCYDYYYTCTECGDMHHRDNMHLHNGQYYCDDCYNSIDIDVEEIDEIETEIEVAV